MNQATRPAQASEQRPVALPLQAARLPSDLFAFLPGTEWEPQGTTLRREATYRRTSCSVVAETFRETSCGQTGVTLARSYLSCLTEAGFAEIVVEERDLADALHDLAGEAVEEHQGELDRAFNELWDDGR